MRYPLALLSIVFFCTCDRAPEPLEETDELGYRTEYRVDETTGEKEGLSERYDPDGRRVSRENYVAGQLDGTRTTYYPNERPEIVENYQNGQFAGEYMTYDSSGYLRLHGQYVNGTMAGDWIRYYPDGSIREIVAFSDNKENGPFREWNEAGQPVYAGTYANGKEQGTLFAFTDGILSAIRECNEGKCSTVWTPEETTPPPFEAPDMTRPPGVRTTN